MVEDNKEERMSVQVEEFRFWIEGLADAMNDLQQVCYTIASAHGGNKNQA